MGRRIVVIDCQVAGIAGDMLLSAMVDAGASQSKVREAIMACPQFLPGSKIRKVSFDKTVTHGFSATRLQMLCSDPAHERQGSEMLRALSRACDSLGMDQRARTFAHESLKTIISAEAAIHGEDFDKVHLHEASSVDTLADLVGCATALQDLGLLGADIYSTAVAVGGGTLTFSHGTVPNPADAVVRILQGKQFVIAGGPEKGELTTPTGAAMLVNLASKCVDYYPAMIPEKAGYGTGNKQFEGFANLTRLLIGSSPLPVAKDTVCLIETNVDDATGEVMGNLIDRLTDAGAKDVTVVSGTAKKGRPTYLVRVMCDNSLLNTLLDMLFAESGTLGARVQQVERFVLSRAVVIVPVTINGNTFSVHVKIAKDGSGRVTSAKPEFEDIKIIAARCNMPARRVAELVGAQVAQKTGEMK
ncbi:MAG: nickel pincer cofactor biosynthesis protein LarC [Nitrososphaera sp.]|jgi:uncharacterized protein (TIGR00299 family) protein